MGKGSWMSVDLSAALEALRAGKAVVFPTDTVYGLGVSVEHAKTPQAIYDIKRRDAGKPIAWLVGGPEALDRYGVDVPQQARELAAAHWPGALTIIVKASNAVPEAFRSQEGTIGLRMPASPVALELIEQLGSPLATSSANLSGGLNPRTAADLDETLKTAVAAIVEDDLMESGVASTVIDCSQGTISIIRQGGIMVDQASEPIAETIVETATEAVEEGVAAAEIVAEAAETAPVEAIEAPAAESASVEDAEATATNTAPAQSSATFTVALAYPSADGKSQINAKIWTNDAFGTPETPGAEAPKGIIQIVHGMAEYIDRYDEMARWFVNRGFVVCAEDHIGHGGTANGAAEFGHMPVKGGKDILIADVNRLRTLVSKGYPGVPYIMYGHSMGSFIVRAYIARYGQGLAAAVLSGTGNVPAGLSKMGRGLSRFLASTRGETYRSKLIDGMGAGGYGKQIKNARTQLDWLSTDDRVVDAYIADPLCGFMFTVGGYATLLDLTSEVVTLECAIKVPKNLPCLFVAGDGDPVGDFGKGVEAAAQLLRDAGVEKVDHKIYAGMRHEIHNEFGRERVFDDVATWLEAQL